MKRPTQADVARAAGVSRATVSYVLHNKNQRVPISEATRQRVLNAIAQLGYEVNARAQSLRSGDSKTIGVLLPIYENPFFWQMLYGISSEAEIAGYSLLLAHNTLTRDQEQESLKELARQQVDGLVLLISFKMLPAQILTQLYKTDRPVVSISSTESEFDTILNGYSEGTRALMTHLFGLGHQRIGFIYGVADASQGYDRLTIYQQVLREAGLPFDASLVMQCGQNIEDGYEAACTMLSRTDRPTALLVINDLLAIAVIRAAADLNLRVPEDISIAGFDNIPFSSYTVPRLTTVAGQPEENARKAVRLLLKRLEEPQRPQQVIQSGWELLIRESTGPAPQLS